MEVSLKQCRTQQHWNLYYECLLHETAVVIVDDSGLLLYLWKVRPFIVLPPKLLYYYSILCLVLSFANFGCAWYFRTWNYNFPLTKNIFPSHNLVCYHIVTPSFWFPISANLAGSMSYPYFPPLAFLLYFIKLYLSIFAPKFALLPYILLGTSLY